MAAPSFSGNAHGSSLSAILATANDGPGVWNRSFASAGTSSWLVAVKVLVMPKPLATAVRSALCDGQAGLPPGLAEVLVVEHQDGEVARRLIGDHRKRADPHHHLAVAGEAQHAAIGLGDRDTERGREGEAHAAPGIEVLRVVAGGRAIPGRAAETRNDERARPHFSSSATNGRRWILLERTAVETLTYSFLTKPLRTDHSLADEHRGRLVAVEGQIGGGRERLADLVGRDRPGSTSRPSPRAPVLVPCPIGICHGLNSPHWPRMVTSIRQRRAEG